MIAGGLTLTDAPAVDARWLDALLTTAECERETPILDFDTVAMCRFEGNALDALCTLLTRCRAPHRRAGQPAAHPCPAARAKSRSREIANLKNSSLSENELKPRHRPRWRPADGTGPSVQIVRLA